MTPRDVLEKYFNHPHFRPVQEDIVNSVLAGMDTLAILPTGGGKSVCFQVPALMMEGICLVITPLIALMQDQVEHLRQRRIPAIAIHSGMSSREIDMSLDNCIYGNIKFLYLSPERLQSELFKERLAKMKVALVAVDEAHCISQWGYDFRPSYLLISELRQQIYAGVPFVALTASATPRVRKDIREKLEFTGEAEFFRSFARENLSYSVRRVEDKVAKVMEILENVPGSSIIYVRSRKVTRDIAVLLKKKGIQATYYHAGLNQNEKQSRQMAWLGGSERVMVATNAFGMGIDKPDVRTVIHYDIPPDMESYYQEAGRAGRDGDKAYAVLLYHPLDSELQQRQLELRHPDPEYLRRIYQALANYYNLAIGSGQDQWFDFDLTAFAETYRLDALNAYHAVKRLEEEGYVQLNEGFFRHSGVIMLVNKTDLYKFEIAQAWSEPYIKALLRLYGGELFGNFVAIDEQKIARSASLSPVQVKEGLQQLAKADILDYSPRKDKPQLTFTQPRASASGMALNARRLRERKLHAAEKLEVMKTYVETTHRCRTLFILQYFGEEKSHPCGICDICVEKKHREDLSDEMRLREHILELAAEGEQTVEDIVNRLGSDQQDRILSIIREMAENRMIRYTEEWKVIIN